MPFSQSKFLFLRLSSLGDLVLLVPALLRLRRAFPGAAIHLVTKDRYAGLFDNNSYLDAVLTIGRGGPMELARMRRRLARERYDVIVDAHGVIRSAILYHTLGSPTKIRIQKPQIEKFALIAGKVNLYRDVETQSQRYRRLVAALGAETDGDDPEMPLPADAIAAADGVFARLPPGGLGPIAFAPGARWETKTWPPGHFATLIELAARRGFVPLLVGGPSDRGRNASIAAAVSPAPVDLTGTLAITHTAAVLKGCRALVTNDSAALHIAEAVGTPVVALFGPTVREFGYFPRLPQSVALETQLPCRPCSRNGARPCPLETKECLTSIAPARALEALEGVAVGSGGSA